MKQKEIYDMELILTQIFAVFLAAAPSLSAIIGIIVAVKKSIREAKQNSAETVAELQQIKDVIFSTKEYTELKNQLVMVHRENVELKRTMNNLLTKIDHVVRESDANEQEN
jgi:3-keto-L-gulonate-6-phosphate decarboxylase